MSPSDAPTLHARPLEAVMGGPQDDGLAPMLAAQAESAQRFAELMPRVVRRALADADAADIDQAIAEKYGPHGQIALEKAGKTHGKVTVDLPGGLVLHIPTDPMTLQPVLQVLIHLGASRQS